MLWNTSCRLTVKARAKAMTLYFPCKFVFLTRGYSTQHPAIDNGWGDTVGGPHVDMYSPAAGTVVKIVDGYGNDKTKGYGNYIQIDHGSGIQTILAHCLKGAFKVKVGDKVSALQAVCKMGNSGNSNGCHVHFCVLIDGVRKDPLLYCYALDGWHDVYAKTAQQYNIMRKKANPAEQYATARNSAVDQLFVKADKLRARSTPSLDGEIYGYMPQGFYNVIDTRTVEGYKWCKIEDDLYAAVTDGYSEFLPGQSGREKELEKALQDVLDLVNTVLKSK